MKRGSMTGLAWIALLGSVLALGLLYAQSSAPVEGRQAQVPVTSQTLEGTTPSPMFAFTLTMEAGLPIRDMDYDPDPTTTYTDAFPMPVLPTPIPTPDVHAITVPELDGIAFVNPRPLQLPVERHSSFGLVAWAPDSKRYVGTFLTSETLWIGDGGYSVSDLYMGNADTGELTLWQHNGDWPAWSRDGRSVYYLALRSDGQRFYFDLYRRTVDSGESELIVQDVGDTGTQPSAMETEDGSLLMLNREYQPVLLRLTDGKAEFLPLASLIGMNEILERTCLSLAPDGHTVAVIPCCGKPFFVIDLAVNKIVAEIGEAADLDINVAWSADSRRLAYASRNGVFIYDLATSQVQTLVTRQDLGFPKSDPRSTFGIPIWSTDERVVLFSASTPDWGYMTDMGSHWDNFLFAATSDGNYWKALSRDLVDRIAPDKTRAIAARWNLEIDRETKYLVDVVWKLGRQDNGCQNLFRRTCV